MSANFSEVHAVDGKYTAIQNAAGSLEKYGLTNTAADKVLAGSKALYNAAYADIVAVNGGDITTARLEEQLDMGFGMTVDFDFYMPQSGMVDGEDMEFDFLGDDDVFVYLGIWNGTSYEYKLVLDIGGIHGAKKGNINFATGVVVDCPSDTETERTSSLKDIFGDEYAKYFDGETFADFTKLSLKFFYLERGGNISYCRLRFNIPTLPDDSLTIGKALDQDVLGSQTYHFRLLKAELNVETNQYEATNKLYFPAKTEYIITGTNETGKTDENGYFTLTPGQSVTFTDVLNKSEGATYYVVEEVISSEVDDQFTIASPICSVNGTAVEVSEVVGCADPTYRTEAVELRNTATLSATRAANMEVVGFTNMIVEENLGTLRITKQIKKGAEIDPTLTFDMRVTIGDKLLPVGTAYDVVNTATGETIRQAVVTKAGIVSLMAGETVVIERILSTSTFEVVEASYNAAPSYFSDSESVTCTSSKAYGTMPLGGTVEILVVNDDSSGLVVDKTVEAGKTAEDFTLTLDAFATGTETTITSTTPADIVLVLDQSASMYTPKGADADRYDCWDNPNTVNNIKGIGKIDPADMKTEKGAKLGYYVAQSKTANRTVNGSALYDWFVIQYVDGTGWVYVRVEDTTTPVTVSAAEQYVHDSGNQYYKTVVSDEGSGKLDSDFYYYESRYAALYESVAAFVESLASTEVDHRIAITGFASPYYDGVKDTTSDYRGTGLYIDGTYYLYDSDYKYWGYQNSGATYGYTLVVSDEVYASMSGVLPSEMEGDTWVRQTNAPAGVTMVRLDPNKAGTYFAPFPADASLLAYNDLTNTQYASALVPVSAADGQTGNTVVSQSVLNSIEAIKTNYSQTCPAAGLDMAKQIFANRVDGDGRDKIIILFTDGVPTVSLNADREHGASQNAGEREEFYSGMSGAEDAVNLANVLKSEYGVQIYTIGTSGLVADVPVETNNDNMGAVIASVSGEVFLSYVSSDYEGVSCVHTVTTEDGDNAVLTSSKLVFSQTIDGNTVEINENTAVRAASIYAKTSEDGISAAFEQIMKSVSTPQRDAGWQRSPA